MSDILQKRNTIYGVCAIWIVLFHVFRRIGSPFIPVITNVISIGNVAVDIFFFLSGLCLSLSVEKHHYDKIGWKLFFKRRITRVLIPYLIIGIPYFVWASVFERSGSIVNRFVYFCANISSATFWIKGTQTTWFVYGILLFYLLFPLINTFVRKAATWKKIAVLVCIIIFAVITSYIPILQNSTIVWARLPIFYIGVIAGTGSYYKKTISKSVMIISCIVAVLLGSLVSVSELLDLFAIPQVYRFLLYIPLSLALLMVTVPIKRIRLFELFGSMSLEIYLVHITLLHPLKQFGYIDLLGNWLYLILPVISLMISWLILMCENLILKKGKQNESIQHI